MPHTVTMAVPFKDTKSGITRLTFVFGQAMCLNIPLSPNGEILLEKEMKKLPGPSFVQSLVWYTTGYRPILQDFVVTAQGCSLVALSAALVQAYKPEDSAWILYEIAKMSVPEPPTMFTPAPQQWRTLVKIAAPVLNNSMFKNYLQRISKITGNDIPHTCPHSFSLTAAKNILDLGQVVKGNLPDIVIKDDCTCAWVIAWADYFLCLRVDVIDKEGLCIYANHDIKNTSAQVTVHLGSCRNVRNRPGLVGFGYEPEVKSVRSRQERIGEYLGSDEKSGSKGRDLKYEAANLV